VEAVGIGAQSSELRIPWVITEDLSASQSHPRRSEGATPHMSNWKIPTYKRENGDYEGGGKRGRNIIRQYWKLPILRKIRGLRGYKYRNDASGKGKQFHSTTNTFGGGRSLERGIGSVFLGKFVRRGECCEVNGFHHLCVQVPCLWGVEWEP
jgi:hypothetical protein